MDGLGTHWELWALASGGLTPLEVIRIGTIFGAEAIGFGKDLGSLEPGKLADLIVLDKNPLEDIRNTEAIRMVMKNGRLYQGDDLQEIWPRRRSLPAFWWATEVPKGQADGQPGEGRSSAEPSRRVSAVAPCYRALRSNVREISS